MAKRNLCRVKVENFCSFSGSQEVFFTANTKYSSKKNNDIKLINVDNYGKILPVSVFYGANAAGKSNFLEVFNALDSLLTRKNVEKSRPLPYRPFAAKTAKQDGTEFELEFVIEDAVYLYCVKFNEQKILYESLSSLGNKQKFKQLYCMQDGVFLLPDDSELSQTSKDEVRDWLETRKDVTVLEILGIKNVEPYNQALDFVRFKKTGTLAKKLYEDEELKQNVLAVLKHIDVGITDIIVTKEDTDFSEFTQGRSLPKELVKDIEETLKYRLKFNHKGLQRPLETWEESDGTTKFLKKISRYLPALLKHGGVFGVDEIEDGLHPLLVKLIIQMFHDSRINKAGAQLICSTHEVGLLNAEFLRRDEIWFVEKDTEYGNSIIYPLSQFVDVRNGADYEAHYIKGRFGAIPFLPSLESIAQSLDEEKNA